MAILRHLGPLPNFRWPPRRVAGRFRNLGDPWTPGLPDVLRWKLGLGPAESAAPSSFSTPSPAMATPNRAQIDRPDRASIAATWIGHSTFLLQVAGLNILTDPIFSPYCSPFPIPRLRRAVPPALTIRELPPLDLILLSHAHYDHLDHPSLRQLGPSIPIACPLGLGSVLHRWGFPQAVEFGWGDRGELGAAQIISLPVQHGAARTAFDRNATLWCGWMLDISGRRIFFAGDTGYAPYFPDLLAQFAPVDLALLPIGAYAPRWFMQPLHMNPTEAVQTHGDLRAQVSIAMHWGTFRLTDEPLDAPPAQLRHALALSSIPESAFRIAGFGETIALSPGPPS